MGALWAFGRFWYDFLVGDRWELFAGPIAALVLAGAVTRAGVPGLLAGGLLFLSITLVGGASIAWALRE